MCHGFAPRDWSIEPREALEEEFEEELDTEESGQPSFAEDDPAEDVEIITDGGEDEE